MYAQNHFTDSISYEDIRYGINLVIVPVYKNEEVTNTKNNRRELF